MNFMCIFFPSSEMEATSTLLAQRFIFVRLRPRLSHSEAFPISTFFPCVVGASIERVRHIKDALSPVS